MQQQIFNQLEQVCIRCMPVPEEDKAHLFSEVVMINDFAYSPLNRLTRENVSIFKSMRRHVKHRYNLDDQQYKFVKQVIEHTLRRD